MSRWIETSEDGKSIKETIASMDECKQMCNEVCCHPLSDNVGELVASEYCINRCPHFEKEDGVISENTESL